MQLIRLQHHGFEVSSFAGSQSFIESWSVTPEGVSQVAGVPPLLQDVLKVVSLLQHRISMLLKGGGEI